MRFGMCARSLATGDRNQWLDEGEQRVSYGFLCLLTSSLWCGIPALLVIGQFSDPKLIGEEEDIIQAGCM